MQLIINTLKHYLSIYLSGPVHYLSIYQGKGQIYAPKYIYKHTHAYMRKHAQTYIKREIKKKQICLNLCTLTQFMYTYIKINICTFITTIFITYNKYVFVFYIYRCMLVGVAMPLFAPLCGCLTARCCYYSRYLRVGRDVTSPSVPATLNYS